MNLEQFAVFKVIAQQKSFTKAAKILNLTQPAISAQIKQVENKYQIRLFNRTNFGVQLTEAGEIFYAYSEKFLTLYNELNIEMSKCKR